MLCGACFKALLWMQRVAWQPFGQQDGMPLQLGAKKMIQRGNDQLIYTTWKSEQGSSYHLSIQVAKTVLKNKGHSSQLPGFAIGSTNSHRNTTYVMVTCF